MRYLSDLTNQQWWSIRRFFDVGKYGNRRKHKIRELVNAVLYLLRTGCQWRLLPKGFPPYSTVHTFYRRHRIKGTWEKIQQYLVKKTRKESGRKASPSYGLIDSQSAKTSGGAAEDKGIDGNKKIKGRKRHVVADTQGNLLNIMVHEANAHDTVYGPQVSGQTLLKYRTIEGFCGDEGYRKPQKIMLRIF